MSDWDTKKNRQLNSDKLAERISDKRKHNWQKEIKPTKFWHA
jgi:hypothetical protein